MSSVFGIFVVGLILGIFLVLLVLLFYWILKMEPASYKSYSPSHNSKINLDNPTLGRMDTPAAQNRYPHWDQINTKSYIGRMDTPPAQKNYPHWDQINTKSYSGRMNTPEAVPDHIFCPYCGREFSHRMRKLALYRKLFYCEYCGKPLDMHV